MALKDHPALERRPGKFTPSHDRHAGSRLIQSGQNVQYGGLAATGMPQHTHELALAHVEVHVLEHRDAFAAFRVRIYLG